MAIYNVTHVNNYMKIAGANDVCTICAKKLCEKEKIGASEAKEKLRAHIENKEAVYLRTSGTDQCICMDCIKDIYDEHIAPMLPEYAEGDK